MQMHMPRSLGRFRHAATLLSIAVVALVAGPLSVASATTGTGAAAISQPGLSTPTPNMPCGVSPSGSAPAKYQHVIWILMENESSTSVIGSPSAPYINKLAGQCGLATNYSAISHPSLPNYIALTSGSLQGISDDANPSAHPLNVPSIFSQLGGDWRGLDESMKTTCEQTNDGLYAVRHNPAAYYTNIRTDCMHKDIPLTTTSNLDADLSAKFTFITPDVCDDMHNDCTGTGNPGKLMTGDKYLSGLIPQIINSTEYQSGTTAIFLTFDEGEDSTNHVVTEAIAPTVKPGTQSGAQFSHYSLLRTTEQMLGLPALGQAATAASMRGAFGL